METLFDIESIHWRIHFRTCTIAALRMHVGEWYVPFGDLQNHGLACTGVSGWDALLKSTSKKVHMTNLLKYCTKCIFPTEARKFNQMEKTTNPFSCEHTSFSSTFLDVLGYSLVLEECIGMQLCCSGSKTFCTIWGCHHTSPIRCNQKWPVFKSFPVDAKAQLCNAGARCAHFKQSVWKKPRHIAWTAHTLSLSSIISGAVEGWNRLHFCHE